jgi:ribosomal protein S18 acetylase RimI-like enzyme
VPLKRRAIASAVAPIAPGNGRRSPVADQPVTRASREPGIVIRPAGAADHGRLWRILEPVIREGETYPLPRDLGMEAALAYWCAPQHEVHVAETVAETGREIVGSYYLRANNLAGGVHVANCGYMVAPTARGRGIAGALCAHSMQRARARGFRAMQFNFVIASNERAVRLWLRLGFAIVGRLPDAYDHPRLGLVDALVMYRHLQGDDPA